MSIIFHSNNEITWVEIEIKKHKLQWYGHVSQSTGLVKTILQGIIPGGRRRYKQRRRWEDNNIGLEWTSLRLNEGEQKGMEGAGCWGICGAPNGRQDYEIDGRPTCNHLPD